MTEYGRGPGSEPWHPEDPLFGDIGWEGQQAHVGQQSSYDGQPQHYPEQPQQPQQYGDWGNGQQADYGQAQQYQVYDEQGHPQQYPDQQQWADQQQYVDQSHQQYVGQQQQYQQGGWDGTQPHAQVPYAADPGDPYAQQAAAYGEQQPDFYGTPDAFPPPEPPGKRRTEPEPEQTDWDPGPDEGEHAFFAGGGDDDDEADDEPEDGRRRGKGKGKGGKGKGGKEKKRRNGCACLVVVLVFGGGLATVSYLGWHFYQNRFGSAPDYAGDGTGSVSVTIPKGAFGSDIGQKLKEAGVVKSVDAFVAAQSQNPDGKKIQAGVFLLKKEMSAAAAVKLMLDPKSQDNLIVAPGWRNAQVYAAIDKKLQISDGTTKAIAKKEFKSFGLPDWANDNSNIKDPLEGFLYPGTYGAAKGMKPETVLKQMVSQANDNYDAIDLSAKAKALNLDSPLQVITVASLVQAEGKTHEDFRKMAEVVYNRLKSTNTETNRYLQFDSTFNYLKGQSNIRISESEINSNKDPYNTYTQKGLPPGPIDNPGAEALAAALNPTHDGWIYFVATDGQNKTEFAKTYAAFQALKEKFNANTGN
ncbi:endolytic transglycosylase MltG [Streptomyces sp. STR69]|uniref:endolytic transglycosylase MltG n=1 Tax=Streptomyces sp. STR69 TaxID=1796942 RepID=UPI0021C9D0AD|nr:endolytic transglycosylase MltG [Streptomyces sp. STR69]